MKKSLLALAVLGAYAGVASAQSSVTIFGVVDLSINQIKNGNDKTTSMQSNQLNSNRLGFRGFEDLGGGLGAGFWLEAGMSNERGFAGGGNGQPAPANGTSLFQRRSTVSLISEAAGEVRLGRDYTPTFWNLAFFDVYGANGLGQTTNLVSLANPTGQISTTGVRANNSVGYFLPGNIGGVYGQVMGALGQGDDNNKCWGGRIGYASGAIDVAFAYGETETFSTDKFKVTNFGASWNFGVAKAFFLYNQNKFGALKENFWEISVGVPLGQGEFRAGYADVDGKGAITGFNNDNRDATQWSIQYIYNLSKRTALYGGYAEIDNDPGSARSVLSASSAVGSAGLLGNKSKGFNVGVRH